MSLKKLKPYQQGELDKLCGVYVVVNAVRLLRRIQCKNKIETLVSEIVDYLGDKNELATVYQAGMTCRLLSTLLKDVVIPQYSVKVHKPFHTRPGAPLVEVIARIKTFTDDGGVVIWGDEKHWTVVRRVTSHSLVLYDSGNCRRWTLDTVRGKSKIAALFCPHFMFFISMDEG